MNIYNVVNTKVSAILEIVEVKSNLIDLVNLGLDSLKAIQLIVSLEEDLGISFDPEDLLIENFSSIERIVATINNYYSTTME